MSKVRPADHCVGSTNAAMKVLLLTVVMLVPAAGSAFADCSGQPQHVAGGVLTDFIDPTHTDGISIGDIRGAVGVEILSQLPIR